MYVCVQVCVFFEDSSGLRVLTEAEIVSYVGSWVIHYSGTFLAQSSHGLSIMVSAVAATDEHDLDSDSSLSKLIEN